MAVKESQRAAADKWDKEHMSYQTVKVKTELLTRFKAACAERGDKVNRVLTDAMQSYVDSTNNRRLE